MFQFENESAVAKQPKEIKKKESESERCMMCSTKKKKQNQTKKS